MPYDIECEYKHVGRWREGLALPFVIFSYNYFAPASKATLLYHQWAFRGAYTFIRLKTFLIHRLFRMGRILRLLGTDCILFGIVIILPCVNSQPTTDNEERQQCHNDMDCRLDSIEDKLDRLQSRCCCYLDTTVVSREHRFHAITTVYPLGQTFHMYIAVISI